MKKLSRHAFMEWLKSFSAKDIVGVSVEGKKCPIAQFLGKGVSVNAAYYGKPGEYGYLNLETGTRKTPGWAKKFIGLIDTTFTHSVYPEVNMAGKITAARALEVLRKAR